MEYETVVPKDVICSAIEYLFKRAKRDAAIFRIDIEYWKSAAEDSVKLAMVTFKLEESKKGMDGFVRWAYYYYKGNRKLVFRRAKKDKEKFVSLDEEKTRDNSDSHSTYNWHNFVSKSRMSAFQSLALKNPETYIIKKEEASERDRTSEMMYEALSDENLSDLHRDLIRKEYGLMGESRRSRKDLMELYGYEEKNADYHRRQAKHKLKKIIIQKLCNIYPKNEQDILADWYGWNGKNRKTTERISEIHGVGEDEIEAIRKRAEEQIQDVADLFPKPHKGDIK